MPCSFDNRLAFTDNTVRFDKSCGFEEFAAAVALVAAGFFAAAVGAFAFDEAVWEESLVVLAVEHLRVFREDVAVLFNFKERFLHKFFVNRALCAGVIVKGGIPSAKQLGNFGVVALGEGFWGYALF